MLGFLGVVEFWVALSSRKGTTLMILKTCTGKMAHAKARIWPWLAYRFQVRSTEASPRSVHPSAVETWVQVCLAHKKQTPL